MAEPPSDPASGRYETLLELGRGGMGRAVLARAVGVGGFERLVVVKRMHQHLLSEPEATRRFIDEARLAAYVHHANVVGIHQIDNDSEGLFLVLDYVEGGSLDEVVDRTALRGEPLPVPIVLRIALDALAGLRALHDARNAQGQRLQILHRDVSPQNVIVGRDGLARITDLGIAKSAIMEFSTDKAYLVGKLLYLAPEYLRRDRVGPTLDIYAMGLTLWTVLAGEEPWQGADEAQLVAHILQDGVPPVSASIPPQLGAIIAKACSYDPSERYQSAKEMADAIEAMGRETGWIASHSDVASFVESLLGVDLERRREHIVAALARRQSSAAQAETLLAKAPAALTGPLAFTMTNEGPSARRRWALPALVLAAGALVGAGLFVRERQVERPAESPAPSVLALSSEPRELPPPPTPEPLKSATPAAPTAEPPSPLPALPARRRQLVAEKRAADPPPQPVAPLPEPAPPPKPPEPAPERPPTLDGITRKNPYR